MSASTNSGNDSRVSHNYRMPIHQKRSNGNDPYNPNVPLRCPSPNPTGRVSRQRRHSTPHISTVRFLELKPSQPTPMVKQHHHHHSDGKPIPMTRERSPVVIRSDAQFSRRRSRSLVKRYYPEEHVTHFSSFVTNQNIAPSFKESASRKNLRTIAETSVTSSSEAPLINQDALAKVPWKDRYRSHLGPFQHDGFIFDDETLSQTSYKPVSHETCPWWDGTCVQRLLNCSRCMCYYRCPFCCWISCLLLALALVIVIFLVIGFFPA